MHALAFFYHELVKAGLWRSVLQAFINVFIIGLLFGAVKGTIQRLWREHISTQHDIADKLDPTTPGGIHDLSHAANAIERLEHIQRELSGLSAAVHARGEELSRRDDAGPQKG
jgi:hypothetical protein